MIKEKKYPTRMTMGKEASNVDDQGKEASCDDVKCNEEYDNYYKVKEAIKFNHNQKETSIQM